MNDRRDGLLALSLFALLFSIYLLTFSGVFHSSDEVSMLAVTDSLARRGELDINLYRWLGLQQGQFGLDGNLYSHKGLGTSLGAFPLTWLALQWPRLGNVQTAMLTMAFVTALTGALLFLYVRQLRFGRGVALGVALLYGLATMAWVYARYLFSESLTGLALLAAALFLLRYRDRGRAVDVVLAGICLGVTVLTRLNDAVVIALFALLLVAYAWRRGERTLGRLVGLLALMGVSLLAALAADGVYNTLRFGNPLDTGYLFGQREQFSTPLFTGLYGLTFSPGRGLFWHNPILLAALLGWPALVRRHRAEGLLAAGVGLYYLLFWSLWYLWWGGHSWGPRFLVAALPFAILPLAPVLETLARAAGAVPFRRILLVGLGALAVLSVAVQLLGVAVDFNLYLEDVYAELGLYHPATLFDPAYSPLLRQIAYVRPGNLDMAWARGGAVNWLALLVGTSLVLISGLALLSAWHGRRRRGAGVGLLILVGLGAIGSLLLYAPTGDMAEAARDLAVMERPGEAAALTDPLLTEAFQDAYDGHLPVWGVPDRDDVGGEHDATWVIGPGDPDPAAARFQIGAVRLDLYPPPGSPFDAARLPVLPAEGVANLGNEVGLVAVHLDVTSVRPGETLPVTLYWRALAAMDVSYTVFVQAIDEEGGKAGQVDRLPCQGGCPTTTWRPGDLVGERYDLAILPDAPPGRYWLIAGMYDLATGEHLPWLDAEGNVAGSYLLVGTVDVQP
jgi:4-amino-4-deoxy-L-arabinose transferase-like glycosyltransferase